MSRRWYQTDDGRPELVEVVGAAEELVTRQPTAFRVSSKAELLRLAKTSRSHRPDRVRALDLQLDIWDADALRALKELGPLRVLRLPMSLLLSEGQFDVAQWGCLFDCARHAEHICLVPPAAGLDSVRGLPILPAVHRHIRDYFSFLQKVEVEGQGKLTTLPLAMPLKLLVGADASDLLELWREACAHDWVREVVWDKPVNMSDPRYVEGLRLPSLSSADEHTWSLTTLVHLMGKSPDTVLSMGSLRVEEAGKVVPVGALASLQWLVHQYRDVFQPEASPEGGAALVAARNQRKQSRYVGLILRILDVLIQEQHMPVESQRRRRPFAALFRNLPKTAYVAWPKGVQELVRSIPRPAGLALGSGYTGDALLMHCVACMGVAKNQGWQLPFAGRFAAREALQAQTIAVEKLLQKMQGALTHYRAKGGRKSGLAASAARAHDTVDQVVVAGPQQLYIEQLSAGVTMLKLLSEQVLATRSKTDAEVALSEEDIPAVLRTLEAGRAFITPEPASLEAKVEEGAAVAAGAYLP